MHEQLTILKGMVPAHPPLACFRGSLCRLRERVHDGTGIHLFKVQRGASQCNRHDGGNCSCRCCGRGCSKRNAARESRKSISSQEMDFLRTFRGTSIRSEARQYVSGAEDSHRFVANRHPGKCEVLARLTSQRKNR